MKVKSIVKIILDIVMIGLFISLLFVYQTGVVFHEIIGLSILFLFVFHIILNGNWIISVTKNLFSGKIKTKTFWIYLLNVCLLIGIIVVTITGLFISNVVLTAGNYSQSLVIHHKWAAYVTAGLIGIHLFLHLKYLAAMFKKIFTGLKTPLVRRTLSSAVAIVSIAGIIYYNVISVTEKSIYPGITDTTGSGQNRENNYTVSEPPDASTTTSSEQTSASSSEDEEDKKESSTSISSEPTEQAISLSEFLGKMFCNMCPRNCPLSNPHCGKSAKLIQEAKAEYQELYGDQ